MHSVSSVIKSLLTCMFMTAIHILHIYCGITDSNCAPLFRTRTISVNL